MNEKEIIFARRRAGALLLAILMLVMTVVQQPAPYLFSGQAVYASELTIEDSLAGQVLEDSLADQVLEDSLADQDLEDSFATQPLEDSLADQALEEDVVVIAPEVGNENAPEPICGKTEHIHTDTCYQMEKRRGLHCPYGDSSDVILHRHDQNCYEDGVLVCPLQETPDVGILEQVAFLAEDGLDLQGSQEGKVLESLPVGRAEESLSESASLEMASNSQEGAFMEQASNSQEGAFMEQASSSQEGALLELTSNSQEEALLGQVEAGALEDGELPEILFGTSSRLFGSPVSLPLGRGAKLLFTQGSYSAYQEEGIQGLLIYHKDKYLPHTHGEGCYDAQGNLTCDKAQAVLHQHSDACFAMADRLVLICGKEEHIHGEACYEEGASALQEENPEEGASFEAEPVLEELSSQENASPAESEIEEQAPLEVIYGPDGEMVMEYFPEEEAWESSDTEADTETDSEADTAQEPIEYVGELDEPLEVVVIGEEVAGQAEDAQEASPSETSFSEPSVSDPLFSDSLVEEDLQAEIAEEEAVLEAAEEDLLQTLTYAGEGYTVRLSYGEEAQIPEGAYLQVYEIGSDEEYASYLTQARRALGTQEVEKARFFDIKILRNPLDASLDTSLDASLDTSLDPSLDASLDTSLDASLDTSLDPSLDASLDTSLDPSLDSSLESSLEEASLPGVIQPRAAVRVEIISQEEISREAHATVLHFGDEVEVLEASVSGASVSETSASETSVSETSASETSASETSVSGASVSETSASETSVPESSVSEVSVLEASVPEGSSSEPLNVSGDFHFSSVSFITDCFSVFGVIYTAEALTEADESFAETDESFVEDNESPAETDESLTVSDDALAVADESLTVTAEDVKGASTVPVSYAFANGQVVEGSAIQMTQLLQKGAVADASAIANRGVDKSTLQSSLNSAFGISNLTVGIQGAYVRHVNGSEEKIHYAFSKGDQVYYTLTNYNDEDRISRIVEEINGNLESRTLHTGEVILIHLTMNREPSYTKDGLTYKIDGSKAIAYVDPRNIGDATLSNLLVVEGVPFQVAFSQDVEFEYLGLKYKWDESQSRLEIEGYVKNYSDVPTIPASVTYHGVAMNVEDLTYFGSASTLQNKNLLFSQEMLEKMANGAVIGLPDIVTQFNEAIEAAVEGYAQGENNGEAPGKKNVWKKAEYNSATNSIDYTLKYLQLLKKDQPLDFIFGIDQSSTMCIHDATANGVKAPRVMWMMALLQKASYELVSKNGDGYQNRVAFVPWGNSATKSGFLSSAQELTTWFCGSQAYSHVGEGTYHGTAFTALKEQAELSLQSERIPVVVYMSDFVSYHGSSQREIEGIRDFFTSKEVKSYAIVVFNTSENRASSWANAGVYKTTDPGDFMGIFSEIIKEALGYYLKNPLSITDTLSLPLSGKTPAAGTASGELSSQAGKVVWTLGEQSPLLHAGEIYSSTFSVALEGDAVYSGWLPTNQDLIVESDGEEANRIEGDGTIITRAGITLLLKGGDTSGESLCGAGFTLSRGNLTWSLITGSQGEILLPWGEEDKVGEEAAGNRFAFQKNDSYTLTQLSTVDSYVRPAGSWTLTVGEDYKVTTVVNQGSEEENRTLPTGASQGRLELYNDREPTLILDPQGGELSSGLETQFSIDFENEETSHTVDLTAYEPSKEDYLFAGWKQEGAEELIDISYSCFRGEEETITLKAQWLETDAYIARVKSGSTGWRYFERLLTDGDLPGAFPYANGLSGEVVIETLQKESEYYQLGEGFTFDGEGLTSLTLRTKPGVEKSTLIKNQTGTLTPLLHFAVANASLKVEDLILDGRQQKSKGPGGLIRMSKGTDLTLERCLFQGGYASGNGGAVSLETGRDSLLTVVDTSFSGCETSVENGGETGGGALFSSGRILLESSSQEEVYFENCRSAAQGGAMHSNGEEIRLKIEAGGTLRFEGCSTYSDGGAISIQGKAVQISNQGTLCFKDCIAETEEGGGICTDSGSVTLENAPGASLSFTGCKSLKSSGGAIHTGSLTLEENEGSVSFQENFAKGSGGAVYASASLSLKSTGEGNALISDNEAGGNGGAFYAGRMLTVSATGNPPLQVTTCKAGSSGGAFYCGSGAELTNVSFGDKEDSSKLCSCGSQGGSVYASSGAILYTNTTDQELGAYYSKAASTGGAFCLGSSSGSSMDSITLKNQNGGTLAFEHCQITGSASGGAFWSHGDIKIYNNGTVRFQDLDQVGGGTGAAGIGASRSIYMNENQGRICFDNCKLVKGGSGGAIYAGADLYARENAGEICFSNCSAKGTGGAIYAVNRLEITNAQEGKASFTLCEAPSGGALYGKNIVISAKPQGEVILFTKCKATSTSGQGGAIRHESGTMSLTNVSFGVKDDAAQACTSNGYGGAISGGGNGRLIYTNSKQEELGFFYTGDIKSAASTGGTIYGSSAYSVELVNSAGGTIAFDHSRIGSASGGAIFLDGGVFRANDNTGTIYFHDCSTQGGSYAGGAVCARGGFEAKNNAGIIRFRDCQAGSNSGGAIFTGGEGLFAQENIGSFLFEHCTAPGSGGAIYVESGECILEGSGSVRFQESELSQESCYSNGNGGVLCHLGSGELLLQNALFTGGRGGSGKYGGLIYTRSQNAALKGCRLYAGEDEGDVSTVSYSRGGAICHENAAGSLSLTDTQIYGFLATTGDGQGGGVWSNGAHLALSDSCIKHCQASKKGGGIYSEAKAVGIKNQLTVTENALTSASITDAAGVYLKPEDTLITLTGDTQEVYLWIYGNTLSNGRESNLHMGLGAPGLDAVDLRTGGLTGRVGVVNPGIYDRWFGRSSLYRVCGDPVYDQERGDYKVEMFLDDTDTYFAKYQGRLQRRLIWAPLPGEGVCKITDTQGRLLYYDFGDGRREAVFGSLADAFGAFAEWASSPDTFTSSITGETQVKPENIEMLVESYTQAMILYVPDGIEGETLPLTLKTASAQSTDGLYPGPGGICTITRGDFGGSMYAMEGQDVFTVTNLTLDGGNKTDSTYNQNGGIIRSDGAECVLTLTEGATLQNSRIVNHHGGAIYMAPGGSFTMEKGALIKDCYASGCGGALYLEGEAHPVVLISSQSQIRDCQAGENGGFVYSEAGSLRVEDSAFTRQKPGENGAGYGGFFYLARSCSSFCVTHSSLQDFRAGSNGGAIYYDGTGEVEIIDSTFRRSILNKMGASNGGAIYLARSGASLSVTQSGATPTFGDIRASSMGGAIYAASGVSVSLTGSTPTTPMFDHCFSAGDGSGASRGGAVYCAGSLRASNLQLYDCHAGYNHGDNEKEGSIRYASGCGGALALSGTGTAVLENVTITGCSAYMGGGIYTENKTANCLVLKNGTRIEGNLLNPNSGTRTFAAGVYLPDGAATVLTLGSEELEEDTVTIQGNLTATGESSNLRLPVKNQLDNEPGGLLVKSHLTGEIHVVNPGRDGTRFGGENTPKDYDVESVIVSDLPYKTAERREDGGLYWTGEYICKITDEGGALLKTQGRDAVYKSLSDAFADFGAKTFTLEGEEATPVHIELFVDHYKMLSGISLPAKSIILKTAPSGSGDYDYPEESSRPCLLERGNVPRDKQMFILGKNNTSLTFEDLVVDANADKSQFATVSGCIVYASATQGVNVTIRPTATLKNGWSNNGTETHGGALWLSAGALLTIEERSEEQGPAISGSKASGNGGGVFSNQSSSGSLNMDHWWIEGCTANRGGAVYTGAKTLTARSARFLSCSSSGTGGGVCQWNTSSPQTTLESCRFEGCSAGEWSGGLFVGNKDTSPSNRPGSVILLGCSFHNCHGANYGGAVYTNVENLRVGDFLPGVGDPVHSDFQNCYVTGDYGGAVHSENKGSSGSTTLSNVSFQNCFTGTNLGGALYTQTRSLEVTGSSFTNCHAGGGGGAVMSNSNTHQVHFSDCSFTGCSAGGNGGSVYAAGGGNFTMENCQVDGTLEEAFTERISQALGRTVSITKNAGGAAGALYTAAVNVQLGGSDEEKGCSFQNCSAKGDAGAIYIYGREGSVSVQNCTIVNASSQSSCGGLFVGSKGNAWNGSLTVEDSSFERCVGASYGGGICTCLKTVTISDCSLTECATIGSGSGWGGGLCADQNQSDSSLTLTGTCFLGCVNSSELGGGLYTRARNLKATDCVFEGCRSRVHGGGLYQNQSTSSLSTLELSGCSFIGCSALSCGGGVYSSATGSCILKGNLFHGQGAVDAQGATVKNAGSHGGGLYLVAPRVEFLKGSSASGEEVSNWIFSCSAQGNGGGIYFSSAVTIPSGSALTLEDCQADTNGGGIFFNGAASLGDVAFTFKGCHANSANASQGGGGAFFNGKVTLEGSLAFTGCYARSCGGGVYLNAGQAEAFTGLLFTGCKAGWGEVEGSLGSVPGGCAGALYKRDGDLTLSGVLIQNGYASNLGGGIYYAPSKTLTLQEGCKITGCQTGEGGHGSGVYMTPVQ